MKSKIVASPGDVINGWIVMEAPYSDKRSQKLAKVKCKCGNIITKRIVDLRKTNGCSSCQGLRARESVIASYNNIVPIWYYTKAKRRAKEADMSFTVTIEYLSELFQKQNRVCPISGWSMIFSTQSTHDTTASLDRIDTSRGYEPGNVRWVHKTIQGLLHIRNGYDLTDKEVFHVSSDIVQTLSGRYSVNSFEPFTFAA